MSRLTKRILLTALLGLFLTAPGVVRSQGFDAKTLMRTLTFVSGVLNVSTSSKEATAAGGPVTVEVETDLDYTVAQDPQAARILFFQRFGPLAEQFPLERQARLQPR